MTDGPDITTRLGMMIRFARNAQKLSQDEISRASGVRRNFISHVERGIHAGNLLTLCRIASALRMPLWVLLRAAEEDRPSVIVEYIRDSEET